MSQKKTEKLQSLLHDYPELGTGLADFVGEDGNDVVSVVGIYTLLKLRLRAVVDLLPMQKSDEEEFYREDPGN